jgi:hypothetical protein
MRWSIPAVLFLLVTAGPAAAGPPAFAVITGVDAEKGTVTYTVTFGKNKDTVVQAPVAKGCVIKEGSYQLGKPAVTKEGDDVADGLKNPVFQKATDKNPLRVNIYTAAEDDADNGIKQGDVVKILVNPPPQKK